MRSLGTCPKEPHAGEPDDPSVFLEVMPYNLPMGHKNSTLQSSLFLDNRFCR